MSEQEVQWGEWRGEGDYRHFWRPLLNTDSFQELTPAYLNALEREVRDLRAYKVLADEAAGGVRYIKNHMPQLQCPWRRADWMEWLARYDALAGTSEGEQKK